MGYPIQRIRRPAGEDVQGRAADRARLLEKVAIGLAHEGKNPLHNMVLHLQLMSEKLASPELKGGSPIEKHLSAMRDGIGRVDALLRSFGDFAAPQHLTPDLGAALKRAFVLFAYEARRASVQLSNSAPATLMVSSDSLYLGDLIAHALVVCIEHARDGGRVAASVQARGAVAVLELHADGGVGNREQALPHLDAARRLAPEAACELSIETPAAGGARLSLSFLHPR
jgi:nitrogen fixation/metabolism regulation signal transduction histidine kinase